MRVGESGVRWLFGASRNFPRARAAAPAATKFAHKLQCSTEVQDMLLKFGMSNQYGEIHGKRVPIYYETISLYTQTTYMKTGIK